MSPQLEFRIQLRCRDQTNSKVPPTKLIGRMDKCISVLYSEFATAHNRVLASKDGGRKLNLFPSRNESSVGISNPTPIHHTLTSGHRRQTRNHDDSPRDRRQMPGCHTRCGDVLRPLEGRRHPQAGHPRRQLALGDETGQRGQHSFQQHGLRTQQLGRPPPASPEAGAFALGSSAAPSATAPARVHLSRKPPASHASQSCGQPLPPGPPSGQNGPFRGLPTRLRTGRQMSEDTSTRYR
ncbi:hypothetical protein CEXT_787661 [Caerostris extrusa]|uniref:Uncharacterized protein n=1 Tax=Caerostris extrusa TaxID=172846 RepID=A0AAV4NWP9_CAEEX|nr:hypothetical protein CEXT_787661 [Caerostris extrusa]